MNMLVFSKDMILVVHDATISKFGGLGGLRDENLLESVLAQPFQTFEGQGLHPEIIDKVCRGAFGIIQNHPFVDGNLSGVEAMTPQKDEKEHLPVFGAGPAYVITIVVLTMTCIVLSQIGVLPYLRIRATIAMFHTAGTIFFAVGIWLWVSAAIKEKLQDNIIENKLITTGVYSVVRNPIYSAFAFVLTGVLLIYGNLYLLLLPFVYWALLTIMMRATEEKWLLEQFGDEYRDYCKRVNRCIPWFPKAE